MIRRYGAFALVALASCGDPMAHGEFKPPYFTIEGVITSLAPIQTTTELRVALLWYGSQNVNAQELGVRSSFPVHFSFDVTSLPPAEALHHIGTGKGSMNLVKQGVDPNLVWAFGTLIVYADNNGNGRFDMVSDVSQTSPDTVLGAASDIEINYLAAGQPPPAEKFLGVLPTAPGFSMVKTTPIIDPVPGACGRFDAMGHMSYLCGGDTIANPVQLPSGATIEIGLGQDPAIQHFSCPSYWGPGDWADWSNEKPGDVCDGPSCKFCEGYHCSLDLPPAGVPVKCSSDGTAYVYKICWDDGASCDTRFCHFGHGERQASDPVPDRWPCR